ncbi:GNAT family N-acetyltransferase [Roseibium alexandrii]|uniref:GNAT family N-acetyltransferase n=1 Tax=Roseibium alexandrii TaxID=388408 RepID=UPI003750427D
MVEISIRKATSIDAARLNQALEQLSMDLGDTHRAGTGDLVRHGFGDHPAFFALLAERESGVIEGALIASPLFSTSLGGAGLYVSDLWVSDMARGQGLGPRLLKAALDEAPSDWTIRFLKLAVHNHNTDARRFYERLGFHDLPDETVLSLEGVALENLRNPT